MKSYHEFCRYCSEELEPTYGNRPNEFCDDACRFKYHNDQKKAKRAIEAIQAKLNILEELIGNDNSISLEIITQLNHLGINVNHNKRGNEIVYWVCRDCGQKRYLKPLDNEICSFCQGKRFKTCIPGKRVKL